MSGTVIFNQMELTGANRILYPVITGLLLWAAWPAKGLAPLLFVALVPILILEYQYFVGEFKGKRIRLFWFAYLGFFIFNLLTTWWIVYASLFGAVMAVIFNSLFMTLAFYFAHLIRVKLKGRTGYIPLIALWLAFEYLHMNWDLSWSWLNLGNGFASWYKVVQWYEFTGALGGTLWILISNVVITQLIVSYQKQEIQKYNQQLNTVVILILLPVVSSLIMYVSYREKEAPVKIAVIQPNIDPYNEKFSGMTSTEQLDRILILADSVVDPTTQFVVAPETALPDGIWENQLTQHEHYQRLVDFMSDKPNLNWVIGLASNYYYEDSSTKSITARKFRDAEGYYDSYNTALFIDANKNFQLHHKSRLVPGVEKLPFPVLFSFFENFAIELGGASGSLGTQKSPSVFKGDGVPSIAPVICYESIYGEYVNGYIQKGASLIFIITNDGWWSDTPGYRQHLRYASLRSIENRRSIARAANTGISAFINQRGDIQQATSWWVPAAISGTLNANESRTIYSRTGDLLGWSSVWISLALTLAAFKVAKTRKS